MNASRSSQRRELFECALAIAACGVALCVLPSPSATAQTTIVGVTCSCNGRLTNYPAGTDCRSKCPGSSGSSSGSGAAYPTVTPPVTPPVDYDRQRREEQERRAREERERQRQAKEEARLKALRDKEDLLRNLKGTQPAANLKGVQEGVLGVKNRGATLDTQIKGTSPSNSYRDVASEWARVHCALYIANAAAHASDQEEAAYLSEQAAQAASGHDKGVECPQAPPIPQLEKKKELGQELPRPLQLFYRALERSTQQQTLRLTNAQKQIPELTAKKHETSKQAQEARQQLEQLKAAPPADLKKPEVVKAKHSELAKALAALKTAHEADAENDKALKSAQKEAAGANALLARNQVLGNKVQNNPDLAGQYLQQLQPAPAKPKQ